MWIKTIDKMVDAISVTVSRNYGSRKCKYVLMATPSIGGLAVTGHIIAGFMEKNEAEVELDSIWSAIERGDKVYKVADELCASLPKFL